MLRNVFAIFLIIREIRDDNVWFNPSNSPGVANCNVFCTVYCVEVVTFILWFGCVIDFSRPVVTVNSCDVTHLTFYPVLFLRSCNGFVL